MPDSSRNCFVFVNLSTSFEIYDNTRCCWKVNKEQADKVDYAFSIYDGMVIEVFKIVQWLPAHSTLKNVTTLEPRPDKDVGRYEFVGNIAPNVINQFLIIENMTFVQNVLQKNDTMKNI